MIEKEKIDWRRNAIFFCYLVGFSTGCTPGYKRE